MKIFALLFTLSMCVGTQAQYGSKERLYKGYFELNSGLETTRSVLSNSTDRLYYDLTLKYSTNSDTVSHLFTQGMAIRDTAQSIIKHVNFMKVLLIAKVEEKTRTEIEALDTLITMQNVRNYDEYITPMDILFPKGSGSFNKPYTFSSLHSKLNQFQYLVEQSWPSEQEMINHLVSIEGWSWGKSLKDKPLIAVLTMLSKIQLDVKLQEIAAIEALVKK